MNQWLRKINLEINRVKSQPQKTIYQMMGISDTRSIEYFEKRGVLFEISGSGALRVKHEDVCVDLPCPTDYLIYKEVFGEELYNFSLLKSDAAVVVDIGMNIGLASLYFARRNDVKFVYAYEPFEDTFNAALINFQLNPLIEKKIISFNFGLGARDEILTVPYSFENKAGVGIGQTFGFRINQCDKVRQVSIKKASAELKAVLEAHPDNPIIAKIDCEGSEYDIIQDLAEKKLLSKFKMILMEWHGETRLPELVDRLRAAGFELTNRRAMVNDIGMIIAFRSSMTLK